MTLYGILSSCAQTEILSYFVLHVATSFNSRQCVVSCYRAHKIINNCFQNYNVYILLLIPCSSSYIIFVIGWEYSH